MERELTLDARALEELVAFLEERHSIYLRRTFYREPPPWTSDPILRSARFTNVYRELDPGTLYALHHVIPEHAAPATAVFRAMMYRLIGREETWEYVGATVRAGSFAFSRERFLEGLLEAGRRTGRIWTGAYMVNAYHFIAPTKPEAVSIIAERLHVALLPWAREHRPPVETRAELHAWLASQTGFGPFLSYQALVDLSYPRPDVFAPDGRSPFLPLPLADNNGFGALGPGARNGLGRLTSWGGRLSEAQLALRMVRDAVNERTAGTLPRPLTIANTCNALCEYDKLCRYRGGRRPKRTFNEEEAWSSGHQQSF